MNKDFIKDVLRDKLRRQANPTINFDVFDLQQQVYKLTDIVKNLFNEIERIQSEGAGLMAIEAVKGDDGVDGITPIAGKDYPTHEQIVSLILASIPTVKDGEDGETPVAGVDYPTKQQVSEMVSSYIESIPKEKAPDFTELLGVAKAEIVAKFPKLNVKEVVKGINNLPIQPEFQIDAIHIKNLPKPRITLGKQGGGGGSGTSTIYQETPVGVINGSNVTYTVTNTITTVINFAINGQYLHPTTDFTFSGMTITFVTPLDSSLSGKPFTITYQ